VAQVAPVRGVAVVLDVLPGRRVGQPVRVALADLRHDGAQRRVLDLDGGVRVRLRGLEALHDAGREDALRRLVQRPLLDQSRVRLQRDDRVRVALEHALDRRRGVEARGDGAAEGFDAGDGGGGRAGDDDVDCGAELVGVLVRAALVRVQ
jgi:hypothetical protein